MIEEANYLEKIQNLLFTLAEHAENKTLPKSLESIDSKALLLDIYNNDSFQSFQKVRFWYLDDIIKETPREKVPKIIELKTIINSFPRDEFYISLRFVGGKKLSSTLNEIKKAVNVLDESDFKHNYQKRSIISHINYTKKEIAPYLRLVKAGVTTQEEFSRARTDLLGYVIEKKRDPLKERIMELERDLIGCKIPGFFSTPRDVALQMVELADIKEGNRILEPSAGKGNIAEVIKEKYSDLDLDVIEINSRLREILELKEFN
ncbi:MAG: hypothetical protein ACXAEU_26050 [Candidatus Hodarchaeales archaeon]|jgi:hypothetical protein